MAFDFHGTDWTSEAMLLPSMTPLLQPKSRFTAALDNAAFTTKIAIHSGAGVLASYGCVALLDTGAPLPFIRRDVLDRMLSVGAASTACEQKCAPRSSGGGWRIGPFEDLDESAPERPIFPRNTVWFAQR